MLRAFSGESSRDMGPEGFRELEKRGLLGESGESRSVGEGQGQCLAGLPPLEMKQQGSGVQEWRSRAESGPPAASSHSREPEAGRSDTRRAGRYREALLPS